MKGGRGYLSVTRNDLSHLMYEVNDSILWVREFGKQNSFFFFGKQRRRLVDYLTSGEKLSVFLGINFHEFNQ